MAMRTPLLFLGFLTLMMSPLSSRALTLSSADTVRVGRMIWKNECAGTVEGLVSWNRGEAFPSLGIGHFIWYPEGQRGPFDESFPRLVALLAKRGVAVPGWVHGPAPWKDRAAMEADPRRVKELRTLLSSPRALEVQTGFLIARLEAALPTLLKAGAKEPDALRERFRRLSATAAGSFALIDYVNFKGEGVLPTERYRGEGWGLLQVLEGMKDGGEPVQAFARSAAEVLRRRVRNAPPERHEERWLPGWLNRVARYPAF